MQILETSYAKIRSWIMQVTLTLQDPRCWEHGATKLCYCCYIPSTLQLPTHLITLQPWRNIFIPVWCVPSFFTESQLAAFIYTLGQPHTHLRMPLWQQSGLSAFKMVLTPNLGFCLHTTSNCITSVITKHIIRKNQGLYSLCGRTFYRKISWNIEAARFVMRLFQSL